MKQVLEGIRVLDFSRVAAGPLCPTYLANFGAQVIKVESSLSPDYTRVASGPYKDNVAGINRSYSFGGTNPSKLSITLNLTKPQGREIVKRLVAISDVTVDNHRPGLMKKWGLGYEELKKVNQRIIMVSESINGQNGPFSQYAGYGPNSTALSGITDLTGWPDREPPGLAEPYPDYIVPFFGVVAVMVALLHRRRTGHGQFIDLCMREAVIQCIGPSVMDFMANGVVQTRMGNRATNASPHGAFPCLGDDRWCTIAVTTDDEWRSLCQVLGHPEWVDDPKFATLVARKQNEDELEALIVEQTRRFAAEELAGLLQRAGVPAGVVKTGKDMVEDPQLAHRCHFIEVAHPVLGRYHVEDWPGRLSKTPPRFSAAPCLGQDNEMVYRGLLGMTDEEFTVLTAAGFFE